MYGRQFSGCTISRRHFKFISFYQYNLGKKLKMTNGTPDHHQVYYDCHTTSINLIFTAHLKKYIGRITLEFSWLSSPWTTRNRPSPTEPFLKQLCHVELIQLPTGTIDFLKKIATLKTLHPLSLRLKSECSVRYLTLFT